MPWFIACVVGFLIILWGIDVSRNRHPLGDEEVLALARKRQRNRALYEYRFSDLQVTADPAEKKSMKSRGEFVACDWQYYDMPARVAGLLKYKKHEWIVIAFIVAKRVYGLWWNKGPDGTRVSSFLHAPSFCVAMGEMRPDTIAIIHNHPNPNPAHYRTLIPSDEDLASAELYHREFHEQGISLLEFICERGTPHLYYAGFAEGVPPVAPIVTEIHEANDSGMFKNYSLRRELRKATTAELIPGGNSLSE